MTIVLHVHDDYTTTLHDGHETVVGLVALAVILGYSEGIDRYGVSQVTARSPSDLMAAGVPLARICPMASRSVWCLTSTVSL